MRGKLGFPLFATVMVVLVMAALPQSIGHAQDCFDENKKPIPCPTKEPPPQDPGSSPAQDNSNKKNNQNSSNTVILATATFTPTPKPTETTLPTATATKPLICNCTTANPVTGSQADSPDAGLPPSAPNPAGFLPWLTGLAGILIGLTLGILARPSILGGNLFRRTARVDPNSLAAGGTSLGDDETTRFVKLTEAGVVDFTPRLSTANQVSEVRVRGYDPDHKKEIVGSARPQSSALGNAPQTATHPKTGEHLKNNDDAIVDVEADAHLEDVHPKFTK